MRRLALIVAALLAASPAAAQSVEQRNAMYRIAAVVALAQKCPGWRVNTVLVDRAAKRFKLRDEDIQPGGKFRAVAEKESADANDAVKKMSEDDACSFVVTQFGPQGEDVRNLMIRR